MEQLLVCPDAAPKASGGANKMPAAGAGFAVARTDANTAPDQLTW